MARRIPRRLREQALLQAGFQCTYCHTPTIITGMPLVIDHIIPQSLGGQTILANLCPSCHSSNEAKGARVNAADPVTEELAELYQPHQQVWRDHFEWSEDGSLIVGRTPVGRATVAALNLNHADIVRARRLWVAVGWHPPVEDL